MAEIKLKIASVVIGSGDGGGSGVAPYYADLPDKPSINGETLSGDMTSEDLGLASSGQAVPSGGTTGQVLAKKSNADNDVQWVNQESGGQGTTNYADLENKPKINNVTLSGNKTAAQLGLQAELESGTNIKTINNQSIVGSGNITIEGGGAEVEANPAGEYPSAVELISLRIGEQVYAVPTPRTPDTQLSDTSTNAVQNKVVKAALDEKAPASNIQKTALANDVQTSLDKADTALQHSDNYVKTGNSSGESSVTDFDPFNDTVHNSTQALSPTQQAQVRQNINAQEKIASMTATSLPYGSSPTVNMLNGVLQLSIPGGADAVNPFKGLFPNLETLKSEYTATKGDYAYVFNSGQTTASIYIYDSSASSSNYWADSGEDTDLGTSIVEPMTEYAKRTLLYCFSKVAWVDQNGASYIQELSEALFTKELVSLDAVFTQGSNIYDTRTPLNELKSNLVVTAHYVDGSSEVLLDNQYELSGTLEQGTSIISVIKDNVTKTFNVDVVLYYIKPSELTFACATVEAHPAIYDYPYTTPIQNRIIHPLFDIFIDGGDEYSITTNTSLGTIDMAINGYDASQYAEIQSLKTISNEQQYNTSWLGAYTTTHIFNSNVVVCRLVYKKNDNSDFSSNPISSIIINKVV